MSPLSKHLLFDKVSDLLPLKDVIESDVDAVHFPAFLLDFSLGPQPHALGRESTL